MAAPRVDDRRLDPVTGHKASFTSAILPPWCRKSPKVGEVLPLLYLHGLSSGDFVPALEGFFGSAAGLSASVVTRLTGQWQAEQEAFMARCLMTVTMSTSGRTACTSTSAWRGPAVLSGDRGRPPGRHQGAGGGGRRLPGVH